MKRHLLICLLASFLVGSRLWAAPASDGPIIIDPEHPHSFRYQRGGHFFPMGDTAYYLIAQPREVISRYLTVRHEQGFNFIRVMAMCEGFWPFRGTPQKPDYSILREDALHKWDWLFDCAAKRGVNIELIVWGYGVEGGAGLWKETPELQAQWLRTLVTRFKDRPNLFMWTIANEFERYPDGQYTFQPADVDWARGIAGKIRELDPHHAIGCHPSVWITDQEKPGERRRPFASYDGFTQRHPQVVWPLWKDSAVSLSITQNNEGVHPRTWGDIKGTSQRGVTYFPTRWMDRDYPVTWTDEGWDFAAAGLEDSIIEDWKHGKPVLNTEFGYQHEPGYATEFNWRTHQCHARDTVRRKAWKIATSGGYFSAGFESTAVRAFTEADVLNNRPQQLRVLYDFFTQKTQYWKLAPHPELIDPHQVLLALPGHEYIAYFPHGGSHAIDLENGDYELEWLHPESGRYYPQPSFSATKGRREFVSPDLPADDWVFHLRRMSDRQVKR
jgi:hypothetical protein